MDTQTLVARHGCALSRSSAWGKSRIDQREQSDIGVMTMAGQTRPKRDVLALMRRLGKNDRIEEAERILPDPVDLERDGDLLTGLGMGVDTAYNELGASPY